MGGEERGVVGVTGAEPGTAATGKQRPSIRGVAAVLLSGVVAAASILAVGWAFNQVEGAIPSIPLCSTCRMHW
jgi:hypothetical protein